MLDLLLDVHDLPRPWLHRQQEVRARAGLAKNELEDKLVVAARIFVYPQARSYLVTAAMPTATQEDAFAKIAEGRWVEASVANNWLLVILSG